MVDRQIVGVFVTMTILNTQASSMCACGHPTQSVQHVVVDCVIHNAPGGFAGLRHLDAATRTWSKELNIDI